MGGTQFTIYTDGASRGNPGPAAIAFVIQRKGHPDIHFSEAIGVATNNFAEYSAMIKALATARDLGAHSVKLHSDSELMVRQLRGDYRVRHPDIIPLFEEARGIIDDIPHVEFVHVPRELNSIADRLGNEALDGKPSNSIVNEKAAKPAAATKKSTSGIAEIVQLLDSFRSRWKRPDGPTVEAAWEELATLLKKHKLLKAPRKKAKEP
jgi:ribonuclease HI